MRFTKPRLKPAGQRRVGEQRIEVDRRLGNRDNMRTCRDRAVQESQCLAVVERTNLGHETGEQIERAIAFRHEAGKRALPVATLLRVGSIDQRPACRFGTVGGRQPGQRQMVAAFIMLPFAQERGAPLLIDEPGGSIGKAAVGIGGRFAPFGIEEHRPAGAEPLQHVVRPRAGRDQLGLGGGFKIGSAEPQCSLEAAVLVEHDAGRDERRPGQMVRQPVGAVAIFRNVQHEKYPFWRR